MKKAHTNPNLIAIVDELKKLRIAKGYSQSQLANIIGADRQYIQQFEKYQINIGCCHLFKIAEALGKKITLTTNQYKP